MFSTSYCGYNVHNPERDTIYRPEGRDDYLFLLITSEMEFYFPKKEIKEENIIYKEGKAFTKKAAHPGDCILFTPGQMQYYTAFGEFSNSFVHFTADEKEVDKYDIPHNKIFTPVRTDKMAQLLKQIQFEYLGNELRKEEIIDLLINQLLIEIERNLKLTNNQEMSELYANLQRVRIYILQHCSEEWDIDRICQAAHMGRSQLYSYYKKFFYMTPKEDLLAARIDKAKYLLTNRELRMSEVAEQSGFKNIYHFTRYFKKECGCSPGKYLMHLESKNTIM
ncbi:MAG: AraC family transcriptional regulator [Butyrivibrio sp.]|nr:AraC family transcriptional regulator [Butyrivibrio sp.]